MVNRWLRVYADTSVFAGAFDPEFSAPGRKLSDEAAAGRSVLVISPVVEAELEQATMRLELSLPALPSSLGKWKSPAMRSTFSCNTKIPNCNAVNALNGYAQIDICAPLEPLTSSFGAAKIRPVRRKVDIEASFPACPFV